MTKDMLEDHLTTHLAKRGRAEVSLQMLEEIFSNHANRNQLDNGVTLYQETERQLLSWCRFKGWQVEVDLPRRVAVFARVERAS